MKHASNPVLPGWYADPELHYFAGRFWLYPTTSLSGKNQHVFRVFSSSNLADWKDEGVGLDLKDVPWSTNRCAWAPAMAERWGRYWIYFSAGDGAGIGVGISPNPQGPFRDAIGRPLVREYPFGAQPIDANVFIDDDGQAYLYFGGWCQCVVVKLNENMIALDGPFHLITPPGYVEGPFMFKRAGRYYFMWSEGCWLDSTYGVAYTIADTPLGPFTSGRRILESDNVVAKGPGHNSVMCLPGTDEWYFCYHRRPMDTDNPHHRCTCIERMYFNPDGSIVPIKMTHVGVPAVTMPVGKR